MGGQETYCGVIAPEGEDWTQDQDTLDTWFSSGLWTFSTLGWPEKTSDLSVYHPTTLIQPGTEILFFWVARMILMSGYALGTIPFKTVLLNGMVRDSQGRKFSKSLGNGGDPIECAEKYGADAIRFYFCVTATPGSDTKLHEDKIKGYKKFTNKVWNITRFILEASEGIDLSVRPPLDARDEAALKEFTEIKEYITEHIEGYKLHLAAEKLYHYTWNTLADVMIEERKSAVTTDPAKVTDVSQETRLSASWTLRFILEDLLKLLHPFIPYVTEEIWQSLPDGASVCKKQPLIITPWPHGDT
jgi:valyl-tRNA synthetase